MRSIFFSNLILCLCLLLPGLRAQARVFTIGKETFGSYLKYHYITTSIGKKPYEDSSGSSTKDFNSGYASNSSYEFGFNFSTPRVSTRLGIEIIKPPITGFAGNDSSGTKLMDAGSEISGYAPKIGFEFNTYFKKAPNSRIYFMFEGGTANVTVYNGYTMTAAGAVAYPTVSSFREELKGSSVLAAGGIGFETVFFDSTTFVFELGYRSLKFSSLKHNAAVTTFQGAVAKGDTATDNVGDDRTLNLGGPYAAILLRFWIF